ncbi:hypothetical protein C7441_11457 [Pseudaminobacter salicylatoxidans]|uniref:Alpha-glutamyl/putrescinyl thymine pyrophosphorylase clade 3 domain-containing protein n=2 Tax=Pseudaminobacter salicylatoxidans TaxID=93369 RepID=A0A316BYN4_PSESE|nr:hypothetical protein C7441_11457 [Pseudaminobacter salicylatoxidans]
MWPTRQMQHEQIASALQTYSANVRNLPGAAGNIARDTLAMQFVASLRREDYYRRVQEKPITARKADPNSGAFDAERAVAYHMQNENVEEAAWLVFLMTHFARPASSGWLRLKQVYGCLGAGMWDWQTVSNNPQAMISWLAANWMNIGGKFGNHRKYESLRPNSNRSFGDVLLSYVGWIGPAGHQAYFAVKIQQTGNNPATIFDTLYRSMSVKTFGRLAKFDYLALIGRYGIAPIEPGSAYFKGATGPASGARLLFTGSHTGVATEAQLQSWVDELDASLHVGMIVMEDALCNWQKSPTAFVHFKG